MKRVKAACILQTLVFQQNSDSFLTNERKLELNRAEVAKYKDGLDKTRTRYQIVDESEQPDGSIVVRVRKQYNNKTDVQEYFN